MPVHIRRLRCRVTVRTGGRTGTATHRSEGPHRPSMHFALPEPAPRGESTRPEPAQTVTEHAAAQEASPTPELKATVNKADPRAVADRVYELMKQEILLGRQRGGHH
jgi:hypothetical protein